MERKQILIDIVARFTERGFKQAAGNLGTIFDSIKQLGAGGGGAAIFGKLFQNVSRLGPALTKLLGPLGALAIIFDKDARSAALFTGALQALGGTAVIPLIPPLNLLRITLGKLFEAGGRIGVSALQAGFRGLAGVIQGAIAPVQNFFNILFQGLRSRAITQFFNQIGEGLEFVKASAIDSNIALETTANTFRAFSRARGAVPGRDIGAEQLEIVRELAIQTGVSFDGLIRASRRFPQVVGNNLELFTRLVRQTINLAFLDPEQGLKGAAFAIANATEGTARGFTSLRTRFEVNAAVINRALQDTSDPIKALEQVLNEIGVTERFVSDQTNTFAIATQQVRGVLAEILRIGGQPVFDLISEQAQRLRDRLFELRPQLFGIAQAVGQAIVEILNRLGIFQSTFLDSFDPIEAFRAGVEFIRRLVNGIFTGINQFLIPAIRTVVDFLNQAFGRESTTQEDTRQQTSFADSLDNVKDKFKEVAEARDRVIAQAKISALAAQAEARAAALAARDAALLAALQERVSKAGARLTDLREAERNQKEVLRIFERTLRGAQRAVDNARDRLRLFDLQTADIPERFTRARRRQLQLEILRAEQAARARKEQVALAREQLKLTRDQLRAQEQLFKRLSSLLDEQKEKQEDAADGAIAGIDTGFAETTLAIGELNAETAKFAEEAAEILKPLTEDFVAGIEAVKEGLAGINFGPIAETIIGGISDAIQVFLTFIQTVIAKWDEILALFRDQGIVGLAVELGRAAGIGLIRAFAGAVTDFLRQNPITNTIVNWIESGFRGAFDFFKDQGGLGGAFANLLPAPSGGSFGPNLGGGFNLGSLPTFGLGGLLDNVGINLNLDAEETRRLQEEGTYRGIANVQNALAGAP